MRVRREDVFYLSGVVEGEDFNGCVEESLLFHNLGRRYHG